MDRLGDFGSGDFGGADDYAIETPPAIGNDERRMHVRAYNHWVSLLDGRAYPSVEDLDPETIPDFGPRSVLLDFTGGFENPAIAWLGDELRIECGLSDDIDTVASVPPRSLLSRLTDHYLQIIANRAPIGFEAEFVNTRGMPTAYRGILLPFSSDDDTIDFIYGVINWKEATSAPEAAALETEVAGALASHSPRPTVRAWADGPHAQPRAPAPDPIEEVEHEEDPAPRGDGLADWLAAARDCADAVKTADSRGRAALYGALGAAYDFALVAGERTEEYAELLEYSGLVAQERAPMTPIVKLIFGVDYDKTRLTEFAAALSYGKRHGLPPGGMRHFLDAYPGGLKAIVAAERRERRPASKPAPIDTTRDAARALEAQTVLTLPGDDEFVLIVARRVDADRVAVIGVAPDDRAILDKVLRAITA